MKKYPDHSKGEVREILEGDMNLFRAVVNHDVKWGLPGTNTPIHDAAHILLAMATEKHPRVALGFPYQGNYASEVYADAIEGMFRLAVSKNNPSLMGEENFIRFVNIKKDEWFSFTETLQWPLEIFDHITEEQARVIYRRLCPSIDYMAFATQGTDPLTLGEADFLKSISARDMYVMMDARHRYDPCSDPELPSPPHCEPK